MDLEADIAITLFPPHVTCRLPKVKVQLGIQAEHSTEYSAEHAWHVNHHDGFICNTNARAFWSTQPKPVFDLNLMYRWPGFFADRPAEPTFPGVILGYPTPHRARVIKNSEGRIRALAAQNEEAWQVLRTAGFGVNIHKWENEVKTETARLGLYLNLGLAVITEKLDDFVPPHLERGLVLPEFSDVLLGLHLDLKETAARQHAAMASGPSFLDAWQDTLQQICAEFNL